MGLPLRAHRETLRGVLYTGLPLVATVCLASVLAFRGGGYILSLTSPVAVGFLIVIAAWLALAQPRSRRVPVAWLAAGSLAILALWSGVSVSWSVGPELSWSAANLVLLYALVAAVALLARPGSGGLRLVAVGVLALGVAVAGYALMGKVLPDVVSHAHRYARLEQPLGYWNTLAIMLVMAAPIALALAARARLLAPLRALAASALALLIVTLLFTFSRGGFLALAVTLAAFFAATRERLSALLSLALVAGPVGLVLYHLRGLSTVFARTDDSVLRTAEGHRLGVWLLATFALVFVLQLGVALAQRWIGSRPRATRAIGWAVLACVLVAAVAGPLTYMSRHGGVRAWASARVDALAATDTGGDAVGRLLVVSSNGRIQLYRMAVRGAAVSPVVGTGAGTFQFVNYRYRDSGMVVRHAHSQWMEALASLGVVGLAILGLAVLALVAAMIIALARARRHTERGLLAAALAASLGFLAHMSVDWDWDMAAVGVVFFLLAFTLAGFREEAERPAEARPADEDAAPAAEPVAEPATDAAPAATAAVDDGRRRWRRLPIAVLGGGVALLCAASWLLPYLSELSQARAVEQAATRPAAAAAAARRAQRLNPLGVEPLLTLAQVELRLGRPEEARAALLKAERLQPQNYLVHYRLGVLLASAYQRPTQAAEQFRAALALNPSHDASARQLGLLE